MFHCEKAAIILTTPLYLSHHCCDVEEEVKPKGLVEIGRNGIKGGYRVIG
jgi:hypothetical protein